MISTPLYFVLLGAITLTPAPYDDSVGGALTTFLEWCAAIPVLQWISFEVVEFTANIALFVPWGVLSVLWLRLLPGAWHPMLYLVAATALALLASVTIETIQHFALPGRVADPRDLLSNSIGGCLGALLATLCYRGGSGR